MSKFAERLKELRLEAGYTQDKLSELTGISQSTISAYEIDKSVPTIDMVAIFCKLFKVTSDYLIGLTD